MHEASRDTQKERPVILDCIDQGDGISKFRFAFEGKAYDMTGPSQTQIEFTDWLSGYASTTPRCACCERVIFPGQPVTLGHVAPEDSGYSHFSQGCNDTAGGFAGSFNATGELESPWAA